MNSSDVPEDGLDEYGEPIDPEVYRLMKCQALHWYGCKVVEYQEHGYNVRKLVANAKRAGRP